MSLTLTFAGPSSPEPASSSLDDEYAILSVLMQESGTGTRFDSLENHDFDSENNVPSVLFDGRNAAEPNAEALAEEYEQNLAIANDGGDLCSHTHAVLTVCGRSKIDDFEAVSDDNTTYILVRDDGVSNRDWTFIYNRFAGALLLFCLWNGSFVAANSAQNITEGVGFYWAFQIDRETRRARIRVNGNAWGAWSDPANATVASAAPVYVFCRGDKAKFSIHTQSFIFATGRALVETEDEDEYLDRIWNNGDGPPNGDPLAV